MTQTLDRLPMGCVEKILCFYINVDRKIKVARITNIANWYFERVVFPGDKLLFEALPEARLEIYATNLSTVALVEIISCDRLRVNGLQIDQKHLSNQEAAFPEVLQPGSTALAIGNESYIAT